MPSKRPPHIDDLGLPPLRQLADRMLAGADTEAAKFCDVRDLTVAGAEGPLPARLYLPSADAPPGPGLVAFHGGGFVFGSLDMHEAFCRRLAHASGARVLSVGYRLAPEAPWPAQHDDAVASASWAFAHAKALGFDPHRIALGGDSAGGLMALWAAASLIADGWAPKALLLLYPLLTLDDAEWAGPPLESLRVVGRISVGYIRRQLGAAALIESAVSDEALRRMPATLLVSGGLDPVRPDAAPFEKRLAALGVSVRSLAFPKLIHGSFNLTHVSPASRQAVQAIGEALAEMLA